MKYTISAAKDGDYILIVVQEVINRQIGIKVIQDSHALGDQLGIDKFLMDLTDAVNEDSTIDQYAFAHTDIPRTDGLNYFAKVAVLVDPADHSHDFIETVLRNAGFNVLLFHDRKEAMTFLNLKANKQQQQTD
ncbi:MAG: hypothetical protein PVF13_07355 [Chromatiales bacterium]|jgi:hypothetical protein